MDETNTLIRALPGEIARALEGLKVPVCSPVVPLSQDLGHVGHHSPRPKTAADKVREHLVAHPEDKALTVRELADKIDVGKSTVQRVLAESEQ